ncbi:hypothetical protein [Malonomonas rubra]|uniref:hypothetical protein n=1 Tax=Malonomonas rubra TaxID=57040 RepID=UPI0026EEF5B2|nr:hypothetical protein [Malonomonas rubra]
MLKPIYPVSCSPALAACQRLMQSLVFWLCEPATTALSINQQNMQPPRFASAIEADWLWHFLQRLDAGQPLLTHAQTIAALPDDRKTVLCVWVHSVSAVEMQFHPVPPAWPVARPGVGEAVWKAFKILMEAFYEKGLRSGLPYLPDGTPVATAGITYKNFVQIFRDAHRLNSDTDAREVCVLCGGPLGQTPEVDHWVAKSAFPLLSVCADNLLPICGECNSTSNKGEKAVHSNGSFVDWYHPYFRPANGSLHLEYVLPKLTVKCKSTQPADQPKVENLNNLLHLADRWTREFKAEHARHLGTLRRREQNRIQKSQTRHTQAEIQDYFHQWKNTDLLPSEPHYEVHQLLCDAMQEQCRLAAWEKELELVL